MSLRRVPLYWSMVRYANAHNRDFAIEHWEFFEQMRSRLSKLSVRASDIRGARVLDVGCGKSYWLTLLLHAHVAHVTGVDTEEVHPGVSLAKYLCILRKNGLERAARTMAWDVLYARAYYRELERCSGLRLSRLMPDVRCADIVRQQQFNNHEFDLVVSHEVFEHIPDVEAAVARLRQLLKPDGVAYIYVHSFTSLSGGHHIAWKYPDTEPSAVVPPWDHLRERAHADIPSWLNGMREREYREIFERHFTLLDWIDTKREGEKLLTPEIRAELIDYSEHELLTKGFIVVAQPKPLQG